MILLFMIYSKIKIKLKNANISNISQWELKQHACGAGGDLFPASTIFLPCSHFQGSVLAILQQHIRTKIEGKGPFSDLINDY
jgi:hypothetical protein